MDKSTSSLSKVLVKEARDVHTSHNRWIKYSFSCLHGLEEGACWGSLAVPNALVPARCNCIFKVHNDRYVELPYSLDCSFMTEPMGVNSLLYSQFPQQILDGIEALGTYSAVMIILEEAC